MICRRSGWSSTASLPDLLAARLRVQLPHLGLGAGLLPVLLKFIRNGNPRRGATIACGYRDRGLMPAAEDPCMDPPGSRYGCGAVLMRRQHHPTEITKFLRMNSVLRVLDRPTFYITGSCT